MDGARRMIRLALVFTSMLAAAPSAQDQAAEICLEDSVGCLLAWEDQHGWGQFTHFSVEPGSRCASVPPTPPWSLYPAHEGTDFTRERFAATLALVRGNAIPGLDLERYGGLCDADLCALAELTELRHLRVATVYDLFFPDSVLSDEGFLSLAGLGQLETLAVNHLGRVDDVTISKVVSELPRIDEVRLWGIAGVGSQEVASACDAAGPIRLELEWMAGCDAELIGLLPNAAVVRHLSLAGNRWLDDAAAAGLARFESLEVLDVSRTELAAAGLAHVARLPKLRSLSMRSLGSEALPAFDVVVRSETLLALDLSGCEWLGRAEIELLFEADRLRVLQLGRCLQLRLSDIERLRKALPECEVLNR